ncbi:MAG TPA: sigma-70 family RNA polymerase sigma factor [Solirubrobacteraceae bacterium]|nr:sigma-70 family RNA polymerase sigma factor [Solirubrobacteraceae bacterium]
MRETRRLLDPSSAQDAAQEAVLRAWRSAGSCSGSDPDPWVRAIARREALRILSRRTNEQLPEASESGSVDDEDLLDAAGRLDVHRALSELSRDEQRVLFLCYWLGLTNTQIAAVLGEPLGTVKVRIHRARGKLAPALGAGAPNGRPPPAPAP